MIKQPITKFPTWVYVNTTLPMYLGGGPVIEIDRIIGIKHSKQYDEDMYRYDIRISIGGKCFVKKLFGKNEGAYFTTAIESPDPNFMLLSKARPVTLKKIFMTIFNQ